MTGHKKYIQFSGNMVQSPLSRRFSNTAHCHESDYRDTGANFFPAHCLEPKYRRNNGANFFKEVFKHRSLPRAKIRRHRSKLLQGGFQRPLTATSHNTETKEQTSSRRSSNTAHCHEPKYRDKGANFFKEVFKHRSLPRAKIQRHRTKFLQGGLQTPLTATSPNTETGTKNEQ